MIGSSRTGNGYSLPDEVQKHQDALEMIVELCREAKAQGTPDNAQAVRDKADALRRRTVILGNATRRVGGGPDWLGRTPPNVLSA